MRIVLPYLSTRVARLFKTEEQNQNRSDRDTQFTRNIQKSTSNVYIFTYYIYSTQIVIIYSISISINVFTSNFYLANEFFSNFTPARTAIYPILSRFEPLQLASSVRVYRVIGGGRRGEDNASGTTYFTQCLHPCRVSVWSRIHVSVFVAGYSSAIEIVLSFCCFWIVR